MKKNLLKRILTLVGIASLVLLMGTTTLMGGCGEPAPATTSSPTTTSETTAVSEEPITLVFSYFEPPESILLITWHRQVMFLKDQDPAGPNYFVIRDTFARRPTKPERVRERSGQRRYQRRQHRG